MKLIIGWEEFLMQIEEIIKGVYETITGNTLKLP